MPRQSKKEQLQEAQNPAAPFLFVEDDLPMRLDLVRAVREGAHKHTGAQLLDNDGLLLRMVEMLCAGWGLKRVAKTLSVSKHSVRAARDELVKRGELAPFKERVVAKYEDAVEQGIANNLDALERNLVPAAQIPVGLGIISDKRALALGEPTSIAQSVAPAEDLTVEKLNAWLANLKPAKVAAPDIASGGNIQIQAEIAGKEGP